MNAPEIGRYIPEWIAHRKNEWVTRTELNYIFKFDFNGQVVTASFVLSRIDALKKKQSCNKGPCGYRYLYLVKEVVARAKAHGYIPLDATAPNIDEEQSKNDESRHVLFKDSFNAQRQINALHKALDLSNIEIAELKKKLHDYVAFNDKAQAVYSIATQLLSATGIKDSPGVYFLVQQNEIVYVGMSKSSVLNRLQGRANLVSHAYMIETHADGAADLERLMIATFNPKGNTKLKVAC